MSKENRINFSSKMAVVAAAAGSAVGLGNIWRFPYELGQYGGAAFLILYILFVVALGIPIMLSEFAIGRIGQTDAVGSFRKIAPGKPWWLVGVMGVVAAFLIMGFYSVVSGWTFEYIYQALTNQFSGKDSAALTASFVEFSSHPFRPIGWAFLFMAISAGIVLLGVKEGIEKSTKFMMPLLFIIIIALMFQLISTIFIKDLIEVKEILRSNLLGVHVLSALIGYAGITISAVYGFLYLSLYKEIKDNKYGLIFQRLPNLEILEKLSFYSALIGFLGLTVAIIIGIIWLPVAFPDFSYFDPKLISTTIVWILYGIGIFLKWNGSWAGRRVITLSIAGFIVAMISVITINFIARSFHAFS